MTARAFGIAVSAFALSAVLWSQTSLPDPGRSFERTITAGEIHTYFLSLSGHEMVRMFFMQVLPFEVTVKLIDPDGSTLTERTSRQNLIFSAPTVAPGEYKLEISAPKNVSSSGQYVIRHVEIRPSAMGDQDLLQADEAYSELRRRAAPDGPSATAKLDAAAALYASRGQAEFQAWSLLLVGQYWVKRSDYHQAADRYARAAAAFEAAGNQVGKARALDFLGDISDVLRDYPKAIQAGLDALALSRANHMADVEAGSLSILGRAYSKLGENQRALEYFRKASALAHQIGDRQREAAALASTASLHSSLGDYEKALVSYQEALKIQQARGSRLDEGAALSNIASAYGSLHQPLKALEYFERAIALFRATDGGRPALATTLSDCAQAYLALHQPAKAVPLLDEALEIARATANRWSEAYTLTNLGRAHRLMNDVDGASPLLADALQIQHELGDAQVEAVTRLEIARVESARGNLEGAQAQSEAAIGLLESLRNKVEVPDLRSALVASIAEFYEFDVDVLMQLYRHAGRQIYMEQALEAAERARARNLLDVLAVAGVPRETPSDPALAAREMKLRQDLDELSAKRIVALRNKTSSAVLAAINKQIDDVWTEYQSTRFKLMATNPLALSAARSAAPGLHSIQGETVDSETRLLEYFLGESRSYLWVISPGAVLGFELPARAQIEEAANVFWDAVKSGIDSVSMERAATRLSRLVLAPAAGVLASKRLLIVADGSLQYVPFAALADPAQPAVYRPLIVGHEVINEPSASALALLRTAQSERKPAPRPLAVFADPVFEADDPRIARNSAAKTPSDPPPAFLTRAAELHFARLPATRREGKSIASLLPESERWLALDFDVSRDVVTGPRLKDYRILHFATHGLLDASRPELSAVALSLFDAHGRPQDGFLRLYEIYGLNLQADLVVLSACETALGKNVRGEGLVGLARGFMHSGTPRVVASLWRVDDQATSELMRRFYAAMLGPEKLPAAAALRAAQLAVRRQERWRSPYYWAAFVLAGEWR